MRRNYWVVVASVLVMGVLEGCRDNLVAPAAAPSAAPAAAVLAPAGHPSLSLNGSGQDGTADFTVDPRGGVFFVGNHAVVFPANSICDPATSGYGDDLWDAPCATISAPIQIHAVARGGAVDFTPELRFAPSSNPTRWVWVVMYTPQAKGSSNANVSILFAPALDAPPVNDALSDPTLRTYVDKQSGVSFRRIKHFSGYIISTGDRCTDPSDPACSTDSAESTTSTTP